ncbi:MAG: hypothetical protein ACR2O1_03895 [Boseongicola sp.]
MRQLLIAGALLLVLVGAFFVLPFRGALAGLDLMVWGQKPEAPLARGTIKLIATILICAPVALGFWGIAALGSDQAGSDVHGYTLMRFRAGVRIFFSLAAFALGVLLLFGVSDDGDALVFRIVMVGFGCGSIFVSVWILISKVRYDNTAVYATEYTGATRRHDWVDLESIDVRKEGQMTHLRFRTGRKAHISVFYQGANELTALAEDKLQTNARTS